MKFVKFTYRSYASKQAALPFKEHGVVWDWKAQDRRGKWKCCRPVASAYSNEKIRPQFNYRSKSDAAATGQKS